MVTIQFSLYHYGDTIRQVIEDTEYSLGYELNGSIIIPQATKDNLIQYLSEKASLASGEYDFGDTNAAYGELASYPTSMNSFSIDSRAAEGVEENYRLLLPQAIEIMYAYDSIVGVAIFCAEPGSDLGVNVFMKADLSTNTITSFKLNDVDELIDEWDDNYVYVTETSSSGSAGWTGKDGYIDNDKSLESAFISNAKPGNAGSTATYKPDEDGYFCLQ